ncbi:MAG: hypothetical protein ACLTMP_14105 [Eggerthella lenta]
MGELERHGIIVDASHLNDAGFKDVRNGERPFATPLERACAGIRATWPTGSCASWPIAAASRGSTSARSS